MEVASNSDGDAASSSSPVTTAIQSNSDNNEASSSSPAATVIPSNTDGSAASTSLPATTVIPSNSDGDVASSSSPAITARTSTSTATRCRLRESPPLPPIMVIDGAFDASSLVTIPSTSRTPVPLISGQLIAPLHPQGLRAFPPEIRIPIFTDALQYAVSNQNAYINSGTTPALLHFLFGSDQVLYGEAFEIFCQLGTFRIIGSTSLRYPPFDEHELDIEQMQLVKGLKIEFRTCCTDVDNTLPLEQVGSLFKTITPSIGYLENNPIFNDLPNIEHLHLDFASVIATERDFVPNYDVIVKATLARFNKVSKITLTLTSQTKPYQINPAPNAWYTCAPPPGVREFENEFLAVIQRALSTNPKLAHVATVSDGTVRPELRINYGVAAHLFTLPPLHTNPLLNPNWMTRRRVSFPRQMWGSVDMPGTTWLWEAKEGETLRWNQGNAVANWTGFMPWEAEDGKSIVWKEDLVSRNGDMVFFR